MNKTGYVRPANLIAGAGVGALLMYLLDKQQGGRRVALARDRMVRLARAGGDLANAGSRDLANRAGGLFSRAYRALSGAAPSDAQLVDRVRARLGRLVSHPRAIAVSAEAGRVILGGPVLRAEESQLVQGVQAVRGVREVENRLEVHATDDGLPALQGGRGRSEPQGAESMQRTWAPGPRLLALAAGATLAGVGLARGRLSGGLLGLAGAGLAARAATNKDIGRLLGISRGRSDWTIEKTVTIAAPRETVFDRWSNYDNFPQFMSFVEAVRRIDETRSHWVVKGPAGTRLEWDAAVTEFVRPEVIAWRSEPGAAVDNAGMVNFEEADGGTRVTVHMSYSPPGGVLGQSVASLLGRDPKTALDADLMRMKSFVETGVPPHDSAQLSPAREAASSIARPAETAALRPVP